MGECAGSAALVDMHRTGSVAPRHADQQFGESIASDFADGQALAESIAHAFGTNRYLASSTGTG